MLPFRFAHEFRGDPNHYWELFFDEAATRKQFAAVDVHDYDILELSRKDGVWTRTIRVTPARDLPLVIRKVTGATLGYTESSVYTVAKGTAVTDVKTSTLANRIDMSGTHELTGIGDGRFTRVFTGSVEVRVAVVGKRIEKLILADMEKSYAVGAELTQAGLDTVASG